MRDGSNVLLAVLSIGAFIAGGAYAQADSGQPAKIQTPAVPVIAARLETADPIRGIIESQLKAFRKSDPAAAYKFASENARKKYGAKDFFIMMRSACTALPDHVSYSFMERKEIGDRALQKIEFLNTDGSGSTGFYKLVKNVDGKWAVDGCLMLESDGQAI
jgi:hypothetical protein